VEFRSLCRGVFDTHKAPDLSDFTRAIEIQAFQVDGDLTPSPPTAETPAHVVLKDSKRAGDKPLTATPVRVIPEVPRIGAVRARVGVIAAQSAQQSRVAKGVVQGTEMAMRNDTGTAVQKMPTVCTLMSAREHRSLTLLDLTEEYEPLQPVIAVSTRGKQPPKPAAFTDLPAERVPEPQALLEPGIWNASSLLKLKHKDYSPEAKVSGTEIKGITFSDLFYLLTKAEQGNGTALVDFMNFLKTPIAAAASYIEVPRVFIAAAKSQSAQFSKALEANFVVTPVGARESVAREPHLPTIALIARSLGKRFAAVQAAASTELSDKMQREREVEAKVWQKPIAAIATPEPKARNPQGSTKGGVKTSLYQTKPKPPMKSEYAGRSAHEYAQKAQRMLRVEKEGEEQKGSKGSPDYLYYVHSNGTPKPSPKPEDDHSAPILLGARWVKPAEFVEGQVVADVVGFQRIAVAHTDITVAIAPHVGPQQIGSYVKFRITRGKHPLVNRWFPLAVGLINIPNPSPTHKPAATILAALPLTSRVNWQRELKRLFPKGLGEAPFDCLPAAEGPSSWLTIAAPNEDRNSFLIDAAWDTRADMSLISAQYYCKNKAKFDAVGAELVSFDMHLSGFDPLSSVQVLGVLTNVPLQFVTESGVAVTHLTDFLVLPCHFNMLIGWAFQKANKVSVFHDPDNVRLSFPGVDSQCFVSYEDRHWDVYASS
jgi:hypothetical protein